MANWRDYYLALIGKMFQGVGNFAITGYILYIMTDFLHRGNQTQSSIQLVNMIMLIFGILMGLVAGPLSNKFKIMKVLLRFAKLYKIAKITPPDTLKNVILCYMYIV